MRKVLAVSTVFLFFGFMFLADAMAGELGSSIPASGKEGMGLGIGVEGNFVLNRDLEKSGSVTSGEVKESNQAIVKVNLQPVNFFNAYLKIGTANLEEKYNWDINRSQKIKFDYGFLSGGGANLLYDLKNNFGIGWDNQFLWWNADADSISGDNNPSFVSKGSVNNYDFQSTVYVRYNVDLGNGHSLMPYLGTCYSYFESKIDKEIKTRDNAYIYTYGDIKNNDNVGVVTGLNYNWGKNVLLNVEGRFISETAITVSGVYKF